MQAVNGKYAEVNGLNIYYEIHGTGQPLVLLHGAFGTVESWAGVLPTLVKTRQVIMIEMQGHGRTADIDRPLSIQQMADDTAALFDHLNIRNADLFGYSMGGVIALGVTIRHPDLVRKVAILGSRTRPMQETSESGAYEQFSMITPETFNFPQVKDPYVRVAPDPLKWPVLVAKILSMIKGSEGFSNEDVKSIQAQTLIMQGDRDGVRPEHAVEIFRLIPNSQLAIFPGGDHFTLFSSPDTILATLIPFLEQTGR